MERRLTRHTPSRLRNATNCRSLVPAVAFEQGTEMATLELKLDEKTNIFAEVEDAPGRVRAADHSEEINAEFAKVTGALRSMAEAVRDWLSNFDGAPDKVKVRYGLRFAGKERRLHQSEAHLGAERCPSAAIDYSRSWLAQLDRCFGSRTPRVAKRCLVDLHWVPLMMKEKVLVRVFHP